MLAILVLIIFFLIVAIFVVVDACELSGVHARRVVAFSPAMKRETIANLKKQNKDAPLSRSLVK